MVSGIIGGEIGYRLLKALGRQDSGASTKVYSTKSKIDILLGEQFIDRIKGKTVIDFGCGFGDEAIEMATRGARKVIGLDIREEVLLSARQKAQQVGIDDRCVFSTSTDETVDLVVSIDAFEHFEEPALILSTMRKLLKPDGRVLAAFGPTWYHPLGGHLFSVFPFAHLMFTEKALIRWRSEFKNDGAKRFSEVAGGLNQMTISRFEKLVRASEFETVMLESVPIKRLKLFSNRITREFTTSFVRCELRPR
ncbi:MAG: class I SAM-dependent methyltransferase [Pyrinomonadaceae bacterium]|nr:class I SAM-dependent methyltransferase [Pyrinomonadaceae bacterium]